MKLKFKILFPFSSQKEKFLLILCHLFECSLFILIWTEDTFYFKTETEEQNSFQLEYLKMWNWTGTKIKYLNHCSVSVNIHHKKESIKIMTYQIYIIHFLFTTTLIFIQILVNFMCKLFNSYQFWITSRFLLLFWFMGHDKNENIFIFDND